MGFVVEPEPDVGQSEAGLTAQQRGAVGAEGVLVGRQGALRACIAAQAQRTHAAAVFVAEAAVLAGGVFGAAPGGLAVVGPD